LLAITKQLAAADPGNAAWQSDLLRSHGILTLLSLQRQQLAPARLHLGEAERIAARFEREQLFTDDAQLARIRSTLAQLRQQLPKEAN
jgi:hypothetical protein